MVNAYPGAGFSKRRIEWSLFAAAFFAFAYFHQGGGWNQNGRFAMVRAMVEQGRVAIDSYLLYSEIRTEQGSTELARVPVRDGEYTLKGKTYALAWTDGQGRRMPIRSNPPGLAAQEVPSAIIDDVAATGDVAFYGGHFHPNKAPGTSFMAVPAYFVVYWLEKLFGVNPDSWQALTCNAWLVSVFSVGLLSAIGVVAFFRLAMAVSGSSAVRSVAAALIFAFGTMFLSYATMLFEHNIIAVASLASFYLLYRLKADSVKGSSVTVNAARNNASFRVFLSGLCAGYAAITNYIMAVLVILLGAYLIWGVRRRRGWIWFGIGVLGPLLLICAYNFTCFGTPFTTNYRHQNPLFQGGNKALLGVFISPQTFDGSMLAYLKHVSSVLAAVLASPFRGLLFSSPALALGVVGLVVLFRRREFRAEAWLLSSILAFFLLFITHFNGWHGGWAAGPRYLVPALPFLALPMVFGFMRFFKIGCALGTLSVAVSMVTVAVDPQPPVGLGTLGLVPGRANVLDEPLAGSFAYNPLTDYELPYFVTGRGGEIVRKNMEGLLDQQDRRWATEGQPPDIRSRKMAELRGRLEQDLERGESDVLGEPLELTPLALATIRGHVSVNPMGIYEGWFYRVFPHQSQEAKWNSFNVGEIVFPESRLSLLPMLMVCGGFACWSIRLAMKSSAPASDAR